MHPAANLSASKLNQAIESHYLLGAMKDSSERTLSVIKDKISNPKNPTHQKNQILLRKRRGGSHMGIKGWPDAIEVNVRSFLIRHSLEKSLNFYKDTLVPGIVNIVKIAEEKKGQNYPLEMRMLWEPWGNKIRDLMGFVCEEYSKNGETSDLKEMIAHLKKEPSIRATLKEKSLCPAEYTSGIHRGFKLSSRINFDRHRSFDLEIQRKKREDKKSGDDRPDIYYLAQIIAGNIRNGKPIDWEETKSKQGTDEERLLYGEELAFIGDSQNLLISAESREQKELRKNVGDFEGWVLKDLEQNHGPKWAEILMMLLGLHDAKGAGANYTTEIHSLAKEHDVTVNEIAHLFVGAVNTRKILLWEDKQHSAKWIREGEVIRVARAVHTQIMAFYLRLNRLPKQHQPNILARELTEAALIPCNKFDGLINGNTLLSPVPDFGNGTKEPWIYEPHHDFTYDLAVTMPNGDPWRETFNAQGRIGA